MVKNEAMQAAVRSSFGYLQEARIGKLHQGQELMELQISIKPNCNEIRCAHSCLLLVRAGVAPSPASQDELQDHAKEDLVSLLVVIVAPFCKFLALERAKMANRDR